MVVELEAPKLELKPGSELKCIVEEEPKGPEVPKVVVVPPEKLVPAGPALVPLPGYPCSAGRRVGPSGSRPGRGTICAKSMTIIRMPYSISRERFKDSSVR